MCSCVCSSECVCVSVPIEYLVQHSTAHSSHKIQIWEQTEWNVIIITKRTNVHINIYTCFLFILLTSFFKSWTHELKLRQFDWDWMCLVCIWVCHLFYCWLHKMYIYKLKLNFIAVAAVCCCCCFWLKCALKQKKRVHEKKTEVISDNRAQNYAQVDLIKRNCSRRMTENKCRS